MIVFLNDFKPLKNAGFECLVRLILGFMLNIKDWGQVTVFQFHILDEELRLCLRRRVDTIEMIGTTGEAILTSLMEVIAEILVDDTGSLCSLHIDEAHGIFVNLPIILQLFPVNLSLVVADIDTVNLVAFRIVGITVKGAPAESERSYKDIIEKEHVQSNNETASYPPCPTGHVLQETHKEPWPLVADRTRYVSFSL